MSRNMLLHTISTSSIAWIILIASLCPNIIVYSDYTLSMSPKVYISENNSYRISMYNPLPVDVEKALLFLDHMMNPSNCECSEYVYVEKVLPSAGFAAQFQLLAKEWLRAAAAVNYDKPVFIGNGIKHYTESEECKNHNYKLSCLFLPQSECEQQIMKTARRIQVRGPKNLHSNVIPQQFRQLGFQAWWGIIQIRLFRLQPKIYDYVMNKARLMGNSSGFPFASPVVGLHVRHGDKSIDGFREHSYEQQVGAIFHSPECLNKVDMKCYINQTSSDPKYELKVFVASDDSNVLQSAVANGHYIVPTHAGISQSSGKVGMANMLAVNQSLGYNASLEIISDIFFLSHCTTLIGMAASQVFRMSVGISNSIGRLKYAAAVDHDQINHVNDMSKKFDVIFTETFAVPKVNQ